MGTLVALHAVALRVALEYAPAHGASADTHAIRYLSMQLRKNYVDELYTANLDALRELASEQRSAKGDFPSPVPIIFTGHPERAAAALDAGADYAVLPAASRADADALDAKRIIWSIGSSDELRELDVAEGARLLLRDGIQTPDALPPKARATGVVDAMQADGSEIAQGRQLAQTCETILVRNACVGDDEDLVYAKYAQTALTSKQSSTFKIGGMTGSTNGHFGTGVSSAATSPEWNRVLREPR